MAGRILVRSVDRLLTMDEAFGAGSLGLVRDGAVVLQDGRICWVGRSESAPTDADEVVDGSGCVGLPGLIDCHTHSVWSGSRSDEWRRRLAGESYSAILEEGGGILSTVRTTRASPLADLARDCAARLSAALDRGITTVEIKSGYGLSPEHERRCLEAARAAGAQVGVDVHLTFLGAHTVPAEWRHDRSAYVEQVIDQQLPAVADLADDIDVYVDRGAFTLEEGVRILQAGGRLGLGMRVHAEQIAHTGIAAAAAELGALSADHLERLDESGVQAMARAGTVAVMLPAAMMYLRDICPPVEMLRAAGVPLAVATDLNPGTSPTGDLWGCATLACVLMRMTVEEALLGITRHGAAALGRTDRGTLAPGQLGDLVLMRTPPGEPTHEDALVQRLDGHRAHAVFRRGIRVR